MRGHAWLWIAVAVGGCGKASGGGGSEVSNAQVAKAILGDKQQSSTVAGLRAALDDLATTLESARQTSAFKPDAKVDAALSKAGAKLDVNFATVARARVLDSAAAADIVAFYAGVAEVKGMLDDHLRAAKADDTILADAKRQQAGATIADGVLAGRSRYAIVLDAHEGAPAEANLVELGPPFCGATLSKTDTCADGPPTAFAYRAAPGATWLKGELGFATADGVPTKKLVLLGTTAVGSSLLSGAAGVASEVLYTRRLQAIADRLTGKNGASGLVDQGGHLASALTREATGG